MTTFVIDYKNGNPYFRRLLSKKCECGGRYIRDCSSGSCRQKCAKCGQPRKSAIKVKPIQTRG